MATHRKSFPAWAIALIIVFVVVVLPVLWGIGVYNKLVTAEGSVGSAWAQVETEYQRRADLTPQLVATVQGAADFEASTFTEVTEARSAWANTAADHDASIEEQIAVSQSFDSALSRLLVTVEAYPELNATENFQTLQSQLEGNENRVAVARKDYNEAATSYNVLIRTVPTKIVASLFGFAAYPLFEASEGSEDAPEVDFEFGE